MKDTGIKVYVRARTENGIGIIPMGIVGSWETITNDYNRLAKIVFRVTSRIQKIDCKFEKVENEALKICSRQECGVVENKNLYPNIYDGTFDIFIGKIKSGTLQKEDGDRIILNVGLRYSPGSEEKNREVSNIIEQTIEEFERDEANLESFRDQSGFSQALNEILENRAKDSTRQNNH